MAGAMGRYQGPTGAAAGVLRRPTDSSDTCPGAGKGLDAPLASSPPTVLYRTPTRCAAHGPRHHATSCGTAHRRIPDGPQELITAAVGARVLPCAPLSSLVLQAMTQPGPVLERAGGGWSGVGGGWGGDWLRRCRPRCVRTRCTTSSSRPDAAHPAGRSHEGTDGRSCGTHRQ